MSASLYGASTVKQRRRSTQDEIALVDEAIIEAVHADHPVTLRGVYYRVVSAGAVDKTELAYRLVGRELLKLRRAGVIPYSWITDGTRWITKPTSWDDLDQMLADAAVSYRRTLWHAQDTEVHIFTEKDAISGVILPVTERWDVPLGVLRGYSSESFAHSVAEAIKDSPKRRVRVYQLGDHDPSGVDAWRAFRESVAGFLGEKVTPELAARIASRFPAIKLTAGAPLGVSEMEPYPDDPADQVGYSFLGGAHFHSADHREVTFARLAVTAEQIQDWDLPTRPTKRSDTRARGFHGDSVEVDAIPAARLRQIVEDAITQHIDPEALRLTQVAERSERDVLARMVGGAS